MLFTQKPREEIARKRFYLGQKAEELKVAAHLIRYVYRQAVATGLPVFTTYGSRQEGGSFAARLAHAAEKVYAQGFERLPIIGNDCPAVTTDLLLCAARSCEDGKMALGPAEDGGVYLIALSKADFDRRRFLQLPWGSTQLFDAFCEWSLVREILPLQIDIDHPYQLFRVLEALPGRHTLFCRFRQLLALHQPARCRILPERPRPVVPRFTPLRAPPCFRPAA